MTTNLSLSALAKLWHREEERSRTPTLDMLREVVERLWEEGAPPDRMRANAHSLRQFQQELVRGDVVRGLHVAGERLFLVGFTSEYGGDIIFEEDLFLENGTFLFYRSGDG